jgi:hypothetical protein
VKKTENFAWKLGNPRDWYWIVREWNWQYGKWATRMTHFVLPGGHTTVSHCHIARCVCRRRAPCCTFKPQWTGSWNRNKIPEPPLWLSICIGTKIVSRLELRKLNGSLGNNNPYWNI